MATRSVLAPARYSARDAGPTGSRRTVGAGPATASRSRSATATARRLARRIARTTEPRNTGWRLVVTRPVFDHATGTFRAAWLGARVAEATSSCPPGVSVIEYALWLPAGATDQSLPRRLVAAGDLRWREVGFLRLVLCDGAVGAALAGTGLREMALQALDAVPLAFLFAEGGADPRVAGLSDDAAAVLVDEVQVHPAVRGQALAHWMVAEALDDRHGLGSGDALVLQASALTSRYAVDPEADLPAAEWGRQQAAICAEYARWGCAMVRCAGASDAVSDPEETVVFWTPLFASRRSALPARR